jgi:cyclopropane-fatty-acyl-phospholipid synthase
MSLRDPVLDFSISTSARNPLGRLERWGLARLQRALDPAPVRLTLADGTTTYKGPVPPVGTLTFHTRGAVLDVLRDPDLNVGERYMDGTLTIEGDLVATLEAIDLALRPSPSDLGHFRARGRANTLDRSRDNVHHHYDLGNDFYTLWLDRDLIYTCAYFPTPDVSLERAQVAKMDHVCRKLRLRPGEHVIEAGCGWGSLARHMARQYGVTVRAYNISREQVRHARERARAEGLADRVEFVEDDYRTINGRCNAFVSIGMLEHVGLADFRTLGEVVHRVLPPERGRGLIHFIGRNWPCRLSAWIRRRIFPGAYPPTVAEMASGVLEPWDLSVLDVENLRPHYALTLRHWLDRFERASDRVTDMFDDRFVRAWRLYLAGSLAAFSTGWLQLFQVTFARGTDNDHPWTRAWLYERGPDDLSAD